jgi:hypothetical protein
MEIGKIVVSGQPRQKVLETLTQQRRLGTVVHACYPSTNRIGIQVGPGKRQDPISKITRAKRAGVVAQEVEYLFSKCKVLSLNPRTAPTPHKKNLTDSLPTLSYFLLTVI